MKEGPKTKEIIDLAKEMLMGPEFIEQKGVHSIVDLGARVGRKSLQEERLNHDLLHIFLNLVP